MARFQGVGARIRERLRALGYWKDERPDVSRFSAEHGYDSGAVYHWLRGRVPEKSLERLARDLKTTPQHLLLGAAEVSKHVAEPRAAHGDGSAEWTRALDFLRTIFRSPDPRDRVGIMVNLEAIAKLVESRSPRVRGAPAERASARPSKQRAAGQGRAQ